MPRPLAPSEIPPGYYQGRALGYIRDVLDVRGPKFGDCLEFIERYKDRLSPVPMVGMVVVFDNEPNGDVGLYVGHSSVLSLDSQGYPRLHHRNINEDCYRGAMWWPGEDIE